MAEEIQSIKENGGSSTIASLDIATKTVSRQTSLKEQDLLRSNSKHSDLVSISMAEDVTMEDVGRILRLEDAHLLESMHFDTGGDTPVLGSIEGNLEEVPPLVYETKAGEALSGRKPSSKIFLKRSASLGDESHLSLGQLARRFSQGDEDVIFRQCLSGEIKSFPATAGTAEDSQGAAGKKRDSEPNDDVAVPEGEETTTSSTCCSHDASVSPAMKLTRVAPDNSAKAMDDKRRISSNDRKMNEAVQFAEAVGEMPPLDSKTNELCIIDEDDLDDTDDEDDNDDGNGTVIRLDELGSQIGSIHEHLSVGDNVSQDALGFGVPKTPTQEGGKQPLNDIPREIIKRKTRPQWPLQLPGWTFSHLDTSTQTSLENTVQDYVYRGIHSNPPEIVKRGMSRGNHVQLHRKAWLEVSDKYHRYGKNLRLYYRHWESLDYPTNMFFDWLDSKGEAAGQPLPNLDECPRSKLDSDTVLYISNPEVTAGYSLRIETEEGRARFLDVDDELVKTGSDGWIFVLRDGVIYGAEKITSINGQSKQRFHHSSFFGGKAVAAAGIFITDDSGFLTRLYPHSGHYRPREAHMQRLLYFLYHQGVDLRTFEMDTQQIMHVARDIIDAKGRDKGKKKEQSGKETSGDGTSSKKEGEKKKKIDSLQLMPAVSVACYVAHKAHFIGEGIFAQIHQIRNANVTSVTEALDHLNGKRRMSARKQPQVDCDQSE